MEIIMNAELKRIVSTAVESFNSCEKYLLENDLSERCVCARFAMHLSKALIGTDYHDYVVDVEYNRGYDGKDRAEKRMYDAPITVDLIVHKRGQSYEYGFTNLICVEMKKSTNRKGCTSDERRLSNMVSYDYGFGYKAGFMIVANMKSRMLEIKREFYLNGD